MAQDSNIVGAVTGTGADVTAGRYLKVITETDAFTNPDSVGAFRAFQENDNGSYTGYGSLASAEVDVDYRLRAGVDTLFDDEHFNSTAQNTGKHTYINTTMTNAWTAGNMTTNSGSITTVNTGSVFATQACFPNSGSNTLSLDCELAFSEQPQTNTFIEFGFGIPSTQLVAPADGVFFRLSSAGLSGVASYNGTETSTGVFPGLAGVGTFQYVTDKKYQFICYQGMTKAVFWVNSGDGASLLGEIPLPAAQGRMTMSQGMQMFLKHRIVGGAAGGVIQAKLGAYCVRSGGSLVACTASTQGNRVFGSYQGTTGGTMGSLASYANSTTPTAAAPSNTALTANLPSGLGGQGYVTAAVAAATDGIWGSHQVPPNTVNTAGRRLVVRGVRISLVNLGAAVATTATTIQFSLAFGHTAVSLATTETASSKAPRRLAIGFATWAVGAPVGAMPQCGDVFVDLGDAPVYVNPGEFIQLVGKFVVGTATASQVIGYTWQPVYGWE